MTQGSLKERGTYEANYHPLWEIFYHLHFSTNTIAPEAGYLQLPKQPIIYPAQIERDTMHQAISEKLAGIQLDLQ